METKVMGEIYQKVATILNEMIPEEWIKIYLYAEVREGMSQVYFYYYPVEPASKPIYSLSIVKIFNLEKQLYQNLKHELYDSFRELWNEFKVQEQEQWTNLTYTLDNTGKMNIDYRYEDISQISPVEIQEKWEAEYLGI